MLINSKLIKYSSDDTFFTQDVIKNEPMLFNCDLEFSLANGGPITKYAINQLNRFHDTHILIKNKQLVIDSRVHMLMKGWYPCIPGWHHDDVPRNTNNGQPNYENPAYRSKHLMMLINGEICPTEFALGKCNLSVPTKGIIYEKWNSDVDCLIDNGLLSVRKVESNAWYSFDDRSFHRGTAAIANGWRYFIRISYDTGRKPTNEIRRQVQVYLDNINQGW